MNKFDIIEFNKMQEQGDLLALDYIEKFLPENLKELYKIVIELNYLLYITENSNILSEIEPLYILKKNELFNNFLEYIKGVIKNEE